MKSKDREKRCTTCLSKNKANKMRSMGLFGLYGFVILCLALYGKTLDTRQLGSKCMWIRGFDGVVAEFCFDLRDRRKHPNI